MKENVNLFQIFKNLKQKIMFVRIMTASRDVDLVNITQKKWADMVLKIGSAYRKNNNLDDLISELLHKIYAFDHCSILFKPYI